MFFIPSTVLSKAPDIVTYITVQDKSNVTLWDETWKGAVREGSSTLYLNGNM
jgi:hypothetical protein